MRLISNLLERCFKERKTMTRATLHGFYHGCSHLTNYEDVPERGPIPFMKSHMRKADSLKHLGGFIIFPWSTWKTSETPLKMHESIYYGHYSWWHCWMLRKMFCFGRQKDYMWKKMTCSKVPRNIILNKSAIISF